MSPPLLTRIGGLVLALAVAGIVLPSPAGAKVTCDASNHLTRLPGLPAEPELDHTYALTLDLPRVHAANPQPVLLAQRCAGDPGTLPPGANDFAEFPGVEEGAAGATFNVRFPRAGRWHLVSMDVSGQFRDHGFYSVRTASASVPAAGGASTRPAVIAVAAITASAGLLFVLLRRRHHVPSSARLDP